MARRKSLGGMVLLGALCWLPPASAQNLLPNPDFDSTTAPWSSNVSWINEFFESEDIDGLPTSGSIRIVNTRDSGGGNGTFQCVSVTAGEAYDASVWVRIPPGQTLTGEAGLRIFWFGNTECSFADDLGADFFFVNTPSTTWTQTGPDAVEAPLGAQSLRFDLGVTKNQAGGAFEARFDSAYLPEPALTTSILGGFMYLTLIAGRTRLARSRLNQ